MSEEVYTLIHQVQEKIERGENFYILMENGIAWNRFCASIYAIEDAQFAIDAYCELPFPEDNKGKYLFTYGLLQAFFLQQDAANGLSIALKNKKINFKQDYPALYKIREIRNDTIGHPTERKHSRGSKDIFSFIQLSQMSMKKEGFDFCLYRQENNFSFENRSVNLSDAVLEQKKSIIRLLTELCNYLDDEYYNYLKQFDGEKMTEIFNLLDYAASKTLEGAPLENWGIESTQNMLEKCKDALSRRYGTWSNQDSFQYLIESIDELFLLVQNFEPNENSQRIRHYLLELLFIKMKELRSMCQEVDEEFEHDLKSVHQEKDR